MQCTNFFLCTEIYVNTYVYVYLLDLSIASEGNYKYATIDLLLISEGIEQ